MTVVPNILKPQSLGKYFCKSLKSGVILPCRTSRVSYFHINRVILGYRILAVMRESYHKHICLAGAYNRCFGRYIIVGHLDVVGVDFAVVVLHVAGAASATSYGHSMYHM